MKRKISSLQLTLTLVYVVCLLLSNITVFKVVSLPFGFETSGADIIFPIVYILSDVFSEVYGYEWSRKTCWFAFIMNIFMVLVFYLTILMPFPDYFTGQEAYMTVLGNTPRAIIASLLALMFGDWANDIVFKKFKKSESHEGFGFRAIVSSLVGELVDSLIVVPILFLGVAPLTSIIMMIVTEVVIKVGYEIVILPITKKVMRKVEEHEQREEREFAQVL